MENDNLHQQAAYQLCQALQPSVRLHFWCNFILGYHYLWALGRGRNKGVGMKPVWWIGRTKDRYLNYTNIDEERRPTRSPSTTSSSTYSLSPALVMGGGGFTFSTTKLFIDIWSLQTERMNQESNLDAVIKITNFFLPQLSGGRAFASAFFAAQWAR